jgi:hypothetical protein
MNKHFYKNGCTDVESSPLQRRENQKKWTAVPHLFGMCKKPFWYAFEVFRNSNDDNGSFQMYPLKAWMSDVSVMALAIASE